MRCDGCNYGTFECARCKQRYSFRVADRQIDLIAGQSILITWEDKGQPVAQIELSQEKVATLTWAEQRRKDAEEHIEELYAAFGYQADNDDHSPVERISYLKNLAAESAAARGIMQELVDYAAERNRVGDNDAEVRWQAIFAKVRQHLGVVNAG